VVAGVEPAMAAGGGSVVAVVDPAMATGGGAVAVRGGGACHAFSGALRWLGEACQGESVGWRPASSC
jgi:hypothetical protein